MYILLIKYILAYFVPDAICRLSTFTLDSRLLYSRSRLFSLDSRLFYSRLFTLGYRLLLSTLDSRHLLSTLHFLLSTLDFLLSTLDIYSRLSTFRYTRQSVIALQLVWKTSQELGVGVVTGKNEDNSDCTYVVTRYKPAGNLYGQSVEMFLREHLMNPSAPILRAVPVKQAVQSRMMNLAVAQAMARVVDVLAMARNGVGLKEATEGNPFGIVPVIKVAAVVVLAKKNRT